MARFGLDGAMIPRTVRRMFDERAEPRMDPGADTAALSFRGRRHLVRVVNQSSSGAMLVFAGVPHIGEEVSVQLPGRPPVAAHVVWVRDGKIGVNFAPPLE